MLPKIRNNKGAEAPLLFLMLRVANPPASWLTRRQ